MEFRKRRVAGVGINDSPTPVSIIENGEQSWVCEKYSRWKHLLNWTKNKGRRVDPCFFHLSDFTEYCESFSDHENKYICDLSGFFDGIVNKSSIVMACEPVRNRLRVLSRNTKNKITFVNNHHCGKTYNCHYTSVDGEYIRKNGFKTELEAHHYGLSKNIEIFEKLIQDEDDVAKQVLAAFIQGMRDCLEEGIEWNPAGEKK